MNLAVLTKLAAISAASVGVSSMSADNVIKNVLYVVYFAAGSVAVIVIIVAGITYITAGNTPANVTKARDMILYSIIGLVVILSAFVITQYVIGRF